MRQRIEQQEQRIATLEQELQGLRKDSRQRKPPSRDSFERKQQERKKKSRKERRKRPGGQPNHPGATLCQVEEPTTTTIHTVEVCQCGSSLAEQPVAGYERRQVFDVPRLRSRSPNTAANASAARTAGSSQSPLPDRRRAAGPVIGCRRWRRICARMDCSYRRTAELFEDLFSMPISEGTLANINAACQPWQGWLIRKAITGQPMACFDETGMSIGGTLTGVASTELLTHYAA